MEMNTWRYIATEDAGGAWQMAVDKAMLECSEKVGMPTLRVYGWRPWCISLGYHQDVSHIDLDRCREHGIDVVRRPTGGRAVFHAQELTYCVIIPNSSDFTLASISEVYGLISRGLARGLRHLGVPAQLQKRSPDLNRHYHDAESAYESVNCFSAAARNEVLAEGRKLIGSAQRRLSWGILQHGSILMGEAHLKLPDYQTGVAPGKRDKLKRIIGKKTVTIGHFLEDVPPPMDVARAIQHGLAQEAELKFVETSLTPDERRRADALIPEFSLLENA